MGHFMWSRGMSFRISESQLAAHELKSSFRFSSEANLLPLPVILQEGGLQKGGDLCLVFGYQVHDVAKKNFRTDKSRDQESLLLKQDRNIVDNPDMSVGTSDKCTTSALMGYL
jgi:hypothetical protein